MRDTLTTESCQKYRYIFCFSFYPRTEFAETEGARLNVPFQESETPREDYEFSENPGSIRCEIILREPTSFKSRFSNQRISQSPKIFLSDHENKTTIDHWSLSSRIN